MADTSIPTDSWAVGAHGRGEILLRYLAARHDAALEQSRGEAVKLAEFLDLFQVIFSGVFTQSEHALLQHFNLP